MPRIRQYAAQYTEAEKETKIQTGLRIPEHKYDAISAMATEMGVSVNSLVLMLMDLGLSVIHLGTEEAHRAALRNQQDIS